MGKDLKAITGEYADLLHNLKERIRAAQVRASLSVNRELVLLYWQIGRDILARQEAQGWGAKVIDRLAVDLRREFPEMKGFSSRNLKYMRAIAEAWPDAQFVQQAAAQIPWFHNCVIIDKLLTPLSVNGISGRPSRTAGVATSSSTTSRATCTAARAKRSPISTARSRIHSPTSPIRS